MPKNTDTDRIPDKDTLLKAFERVTGVVHHTPALTSKTFDEMTGARLVFKCENFQKGGAFKFRGAVNSVYSLSNEAAQRGVATHSSGNHAQAVALAARMRGISATIVMPNSAPQVKVNAVRGYGAEIRFCEPTLKAREAALQEVVAETGATFIHPSNDVRVIAGQSTAFQELRTDAAATAMEGLDIVLAPVGGGGLLSGTALAAKLIEAPERRFSGGPAQTGGPQTGLKSGPPKVIGCEPARADDAYRSFKSGTLVFPEHPDTIADGLKTALGSNTFPIVRTYVDDIVLVQEEEILQAMKLIWERMKIVVEPSSAVPLAALLNGSIEAKGARVGIILSGGNVDLDALPWYR